MLKWNCQDVQYDMYSNAPEVLKDTLVSSIEVVSSIQIGIISTFCPPGVSLDVGVLAHFELYKVFMPWIVLTIFKYIFWDKVSSNQNKKILNYITSWCAELF